ncbi:HEPN-associated N-terminal domain-containing protein [Citricoccus sp. NPDC055426]|uniref:HEPN-associated N-terminal domain-containing protein n=1 Tax=Citricoccus sp. NPDC055426 TaxID=3155536 RepID=UPI00342D684B
MGLTKRYMEEVDARGYSDQSGRVCSKCITEPTLSAVIREEGESWADAEDEAAAACEYCQEVPQAPESLAELERVIELVVGGLRAEYDDPAEEAGWDGREGGYQVPTYDTDDLLREHEVAENGKLIDDIAGAINNTVWCQLHPYESTESQALQWGWSAFCQYVKTRRRFTFLTPEADPTLGAGDIPLHAVPAAVVRSVQHSGLTIVSPAGSTWWRARVHPADEAHKTAKEIGTPPSEHARDNRMTPTGIGAFYGASTLHGARAEVAGYAEADHDATVGQFTQLTDLTFIDLRDWPPVPSLFDDRARHLRGARTFMHDFITDVTKVADPSDTQNLDYIPTQIIAEHLRYDLPVDGILWRSTKDRDVTVCVLFLDNDAMADCDDTNEQSHLGLDPMSVTHISGPL